MDHASTNIRRNKIHKSETFPIHSLEYIYIKISKNKNSPQHLIPIKSIQF